MGIRRDPLDIAFSNLVRERADWTCEKCGKSFPDRKGSGLHASHYWGRRKKSVRWFGNNIWAHCFGCHKHLGANPHEFKSWVFKELGELFYDQLTLRANKPVKYTKVEKIDMKEHYEAQLLKIKAKRMNGETGYINFQDWD